MYNLLGINYTSRQKVKNTRCKLRYFHNIFAKVQYPDVQRPTNEKGKMYKAKEKINIKYQQAFTLKKTYITDKLWKKLLSHISDDKYKVRS